VDGVLIAMVRYVEAQNVWNVLTSEKNWMNMNLEGVKL
jgi:hypothetical protein